MSKKYSPISGICTFANFPYEKDLESIEADAVILGYPLDMAACWRPGARFAPKRIREASSMFDFSEEGYYNFENDTEYLNPNTCKIVDGGDVPIITGDLTTSARLCEEAIRTLAKKHIIPVVLGGDHSTTIPIERGLDCYEDICIIQFDAHLDWSDAPGGQKYSHSSPMRRASELKQFTKMVQIGLRGLGSSRKSDWDDAKAFGSVIIPARQAKKLGAENILKMIPEAKNYYITIDIDGLDTSVARGTGSPAPGGLEYNLVMDILEGVSKLGNVIGLDISEVSPYCDPAGITEYAAAELAINFLGFVLKEREK